MAGKLITPAGVLTARPISAPPSYKANRYPPAGTSPKTTSVTGTVKAQVSATLAANGRAIICLGAIDNLCKGAAGQAVQCANIVVGLPQAAGLPTLALPI